MIQVEAISVTLDNQAVLHDISLNIPNGECTAIIGASGSGKTTLLHAIAGLTPINQGVIHNQPAITDVGLVLQDHGLLPWFTVEENIALALGQRRAPQAKQEDLEQLLADLKLAALRDKRPSQLSGGEAQRVAIARALLKDAKLLLLDEPTASLDEVNSLRLSALLEDIRMRYGTTLVLVTHALEEAANLGYQTLLLDQGRIKECFTQANYSDAIAYRESMRKCLLELADWEAVTS